MLDDLRDYHLEEGGQLITLALLLLKLVEKAGECFRPTLVHLDHLGLDVQQHVVNVVQVLLRKGLEDKQAARIV